MKVRLLFEVTASIDREVEMTQEEYSSYVDRLDAADRSTTRCIEEELFLKAGGSWTDAEFEDDFELEVIEEVKAST